MRGNSNFDEYHTAVPYLIDLQWFAAEDEGRTEDPTDYKIRKAREEGRVAKSQDLTGALVLFFPALLLMFFAPSMMENFLEMMRFFFLRCTTENAVSGKWFGVFIQYFLRLALPVMVAAVFAGVASNLIQNRGFLFSTKPITPKFDKIVPNFAKFFKRALFSVEGLFNLAKSFVKIMIIAVMAFFLIRSNVRVFISMLEVNLFQAVVYLATIAGRLLAFVALSLIVLAIPDYIFQRRQFIESLKMSKQEVKEEYKQLEGDPQVRGRIRQQMQQMLSKNSTRNVEKADVIITNPTHYAVAMQWDSQTMPAPMMLAKGVDVMAQKIKTIAREHDIPIVENKPLARALYAEVELGDIIPEHYYRVLTLILAEVYSLGNKKDELLRRQNRL